MSLRERLEEFTPLTQKRVDELIRWVSIHTKLREESPEHAMLLPLCLAFTRMFNSFSPEDQGQVTRGLEGIGLPLRPGGKHGDIPQVFK